MRRIKSNLWPYLISIFLALSLNLSVIPSLPWLRDSRITMAVVSMVTTALINIVVISVFIKYES